MDSYDLPTVLHAAPDGRYEAKLAAINRTDALSVFPRLARND